MVRLLLKSLKMTAFAGALAIVVSQTQAAQVTWGNGTIGNGIGLLNGTLVPAGDLVRLGSFSLTAAQIKANANNPTFLNANFIQFASTTIGSGNPFNDGSTPAGYWEAPNSINLTTTLGNANTQIYYWIFNATTLAASTQYGVFTAPGNTQWVFPADTAVPNSVTTDLGDVPNSAAGILIGGYGTGSAFGVPEYNLAAVVPEPSSFLLLGVTLIVGFVLIRSRSTVA